MILLLLGHYNNCMGNRIKGEKEISYIVDFNNVSMVGLESSPVKETLAGLRANEARYFMNKYKHEFTIVPANESHETLDYVDRILKKERDIEFAGRRQLLLPVSDNYICRFPSFLFWSFLLSGLRCWAAAVR